MCTAGAYSITGSDPRLQTRCSFRGVWVRNTQLQVLLISPKACILICTIKSLLFLFPHTGGGMLPTPGLMCRWLHRQLAAAG